MLVFKFFTSTLMFGHLTLFVISGNDHMLVITNVYAAAFFILGGIERKLEGKS